jgi:hypothetical protein
LHADDLAAATEVGATAQAIVTMAAGDQRINDNTLAFSVAADDFTADFMAENERCGTSLVVSIIGMHIRTADAAGRDSDEDFALFGNGIRFISIFEFSGCDINQCFHILLYFAVKPPSTAIICPVM